MKRERLKVLQYLFIVTNQLYQSRKECSGCLKLTWQKLDDEFSIEKKQFQKIIMPMKMTNNELRCIWIKPIEETFIWINNFNPPPWVMFRERSSPISTLSCPNTPLITSSYDKINDWETTELAQRGFLIGFWLAACPIFYRRRQSNP